MRYSLKNLRTGEPGYGCRSDEEKESGFRHETEESAQEFHVSRVRHLVHGACPVEEHSFKKAVV
jgi:hypothetical protein